MKRPQSAKQVRNYWAQISTDEGVAKDHSKPFLKMNNKQVMNAVSCNNDFSRLLPKRIQHDKQRLYCQALQLKSNLNQVTQENLRLKTKIAILQRQKDKKYRKDDQFQRGANIGSKTRINEKQQGIVLNLKKLVRQSKEEGQNHKKELLKLKRALRYTKMNELQIEKQTIYAQNRNLAKKIQKLQNQLANQLNQTQQNQNLAVQLQATLNNLKEIQIDNQKYEQLLQEMEMKNKQLSQKIVVLQQKMNRDIAVQKRKADLLNKQNEALRRQNKLLAQKIQQQKKRTNNAKKIIRPASSHPQSNSLSIKNQEVESTKSNPNRQKEIALQINAKLQNELSEARKKLAASQNQLKQQLKNNTLNLSNQPFELDLTKYQAGQLSSHTQKLTNFDKKSKNEVISKTSNPKSANNRKKDEYQSQAIKQLRQILTYRMKYKRYTFQQLKGDIQASPMTLFTYRDLNAMLLDEPFSLNSYYATQFLKVCYGKTKIGQDEEIESDCLINNLRKIIDQFELIDQHEQQQMLYKIADYLTKKRQILNKEFTKLKTKNKLVNKKQIADILSRFAQLSSEEIDLVISYISVNAQNLQKINYEEVLDKFYLNNSQNISQSSSENYSQRIQEKDEELSLGEEEELDQNEQLYGQDQII